MRRDLPVAAQTRGHIQTLTVILRVLLDLTGQGRAGADNAHVTFQNVPQLREFINTCFADELTHTCDTGIVLDFEDRAIHLIFFQKAIQLCFCIRAHGTELIELERLSVASNSHLRKDRASDGSSTTIAIAVTSIKGDSTTSAAKDRITSCVLRPIQYHLWFLRFSFRLISTGFSISIAFIYLLLALISH